MNIYDSCIDNSRVIYRDYTMTWDEQLEQEKKKYEDKGYKVIFIFAANSFCDAARIVLYDNRWTIPLHMQKYRNKYVKFNGHWVIESQLGICDKCGEYKPLVCLCKEGWLCDECDDDD